MGAAAFHSRAAGSRVSGKSLATYLLWIIPGPSAVRLAAAKRKNIHFIILYYTVHDADTKMMQIQKCMKIQKWAFAAAMAVSAGQAQVPTDHKPTIPAVIPDSVSVESNIPYD